MDIKALRKLARECRKLGITHLKTEGVELDITGDVTPARRRTRRASPVNEALFNEPDTAQQQQRALNEYDLLFWSTGAGVNENHS